MSKLHPTVRETPAIYPVLDTTVFAVSRYKGSRHWAIHAPDGSLVCVALYKKGATEVARRLNAPPQAGKEPSL